MTNTELRSQIKNTCRYCGHAPNAGQRNIIAKI